MNKNLMWIIGGVVGLAIVVGLAWAIAGEQPLDESAGFGNPTVTGESLPVGGSGGGDPAVGMTAPTVVGADWKGTEVSIEPDGRPKIIVFLAHWCPHCQAEVPVVQQWVDDGNLPEGVDIYGVTIFTNSARVNFPPQAWLERENWTIPTLMDNSDNAVARGFGVASTPTYAVLDGDNVNLGRASGEIGVAGLNTLAAIAEASIEG